MKLEIIIYLFIALLLSALRRVISGMKNGCFYAKGNSYQVPRLKKYMENIHYLETPAWYTQFGSVFFFILCILRLSNPEAAIIKEVISAMLITMGTSGMASYHYQGYINLGSDKPFVFNENYHPDKPNKSEFAWGNINFWWYRPWVGIKRLYLIPVGIASIITGLIIGLK